MQIITFCKLIVDFSTKFVANCYNKMSKKDTSLQLIHELLKTHKKIGRDKTIQSLIEARLDPKHFRLLVEQKIIYFVCKVFKIGKEKLLNERQKGNRTDALMVLYVLLKKHLDYTLLETSKSLVRDQSVISKSISAFSRLRSEIKREGNILKKYATANRLTVEFIALETEKQKPDGTTDINS